MSADILKFPLPSRQAVIGSFHERELEQVRIYLDRASHLLEKGRRQSGGPEAELQRACYATEAALFHLLTAAGALNADRDLRKLLLDRLAERETSR